MMKVVRTAQFKHSDLPFKILIKQLYTGVILQRRKVEISTFSMRLTVALIVCLTATIN